MCGINGLYGFEDVTLAGEKIKAMTARMQHRGPDDEGVYIADKIALGHRRLSIIDLSSAGHQPLTSSDGRYWIVYNGELYNYKQLKFELQRIVANSNQQSYFFQTNTDTEVIIAAFARWGSDCVNHFNGMFAFAIWDTVKQQLFIARDRLGIKPLYYFYTNGIFGFASEIRSLLAAKVVPPCSDEYGLMDYLRYQTVHAPRTIIKGIKMLLPGHCITIKDKDVKIRKYWQLNSPVDLPPVKHNYQEVCKDVNQLLKNAVERRLVADVPFGAFLSGGIDSSAIVGLMHEISNRQIKTFCVAFDETKFSEATYAEQIARKFNTDHHEIRLTPDDFLNELPHALQAMDHPSGDGPNTYVVSKAAKNAGIKMALSGLGGDELFGGYDVFRRYVEFRKKMFLQNTPHFIRSAGGTLLKKIKPGIASEKIAEFLKQDKLDFAAFYGVNRQVLLNRQIDEVFSADAFIPSSLTAMINENHLPLEDKNVSTITIAEITTYLQNVLLRDTDQMSMANALEVRVPFMDYTLVEYVLNLPDQYKNIQTQKKLLIDAMGEMLPAEIVNRKKMGFVFPWEHWIKNQLKSFCEEKLKNLGKRKGFKQEGIMKLWNAFLKNDPRVSWSRIWILVVLENWMEINGVDK